MSCLEQHQFIILPFYEIKAQQRPKSRCREDSAVRRLEKRIQFLVVFDIFRPPASSSPPSLLWANSGLSLFLAPRSDLPRLLLPLWGALWSHWGPGHRQQWGEGWGGGLGGVGTGDRAQQQQKHNLPLWLEMLILLSTLIPIWQVTNIFIGLRDQIWTSLGNQVFSLNIEF